MGVKKKNGPDFVSIINKRVVARDAVQSSGIASSGPTGRKVLVKWMSLSFHCSEI